MRFSEQRTRETSSTLKREMQSRSAEADAVDAVACVVDTSPCMNVPLVEAGRVQLPREFRFVFEGCF